VRAGQNAQLFLHHRDRQRRVSDDVAGERIGERLELFGRHEMIDDTGGEGTAGDRWSASAAP